METPEAYQNHEENLEARLVSAEAALVQMMGDVVATSQRWIELSNAVQAGEITDVKDLENQYSQFLLLTVLLTTEILQSKYAEVVSAEADRNTMI